MHDKVGMAAAAAARSIFARATFNATTPCAMGLLVARKVAAMRQVTRIADRV